MNEQYVRLMQIPRRISLFVYQIALPYELISLKNVKFLSMK